jgi:hypothetical protein
LTAGAKKFLSGKKYWDGAAVVGLAVMGEVVVGHLLGLSVGVDVVGNLLGLAVGELRLALMQAPLICPP